MRVVKAAQFGIQSALIGGAFVLLGGAALADTSTPATTGPNLPTTQSGTNVKDTNGNSTTVTNNGQGSVNVTNTTNTNDQSGSNSQGGTTLTSTDQNNNSGTPTGTVTNDDNTSGPTAQNATPNNQNSQGNDKSDPTVNAATPKLDQDTAVVQPTETPSVPQSSETAPVAQAAPTVIFQSKPLRIQPVIVTSNLADMAAALPSLPTPASAPVPPKPNSALGHLSAALADTIVPVFFFLISAPVRAGLATLMLATFIVLLLGAFISNYGQWLRRGGFATAARSDAPLTSISSPFATPQLLGYVFAPPRYRHNLVFVVAEIKTGGYSLRGL